MASAAAQKARVPWWCSPGDTNTRASHPPSRNTATPRTTETTVAISADLRTSGRTRPCSPRPTRMATSRTLATSMPNRVAVDAMNANCVATVTTPKIEAPSDLVITTCVAKVATTPAPRPMTFWPAPPRMSRWSANCPLGSTDSRAERNPPRRFTGRSPVRATPGPGLFQVAQAAEVLLHLLGLHVAHGLAVVLRGRRGRLPGPHRRLRAQHRRQDPPAVLHRGGRVQRRQDGRCDVHQVRRRVGERARRHVRPGRHDHP